MTSKATRKGLTTYSHHTISISNKHHKMIVKIAKVEGRSVKNATENLITLAYRFVLK